MTFKQQLIMIGSVLSLCSMLLAIGAVYLFAHGAKWGGAGMGLLAFSSLLVGFLFLASEDPERQ